MKMANAMYCLMVKFPTPTGVGFMQSRKEEARKCHLTSLELPKNIARAVNEITVQKSTA